MRLTSILVLAAAVFLGIVAVLGVRALIQKDRRAAAAAPQTQIASTVVVARQPLEFGLELQEDMLREIPWASAERPEGSFATVAEVLGGERRVSLRSIAPGELVLRDRVSGFGGRATLSQIIDKNHRAVTLRVNDVSGAGGFILPGDRVDVLSTIQPTDDRIDTVTYILLEDVRVLAIDQMADESQEGAVVAKATTLEVTPEDAQRIALASTIGQLTLSLRNLADAAIDQADGDTAAKPEARIIGFRDLGPQKSAAKPAARSVVRKAKAEAKKPSDLTTMKIVRGTESSNVDVLKEAVGPVGTARTTLPPPAQ
jgi:pilus assembly protein CpaB